MAESFFSLPGNLTARFNTACNIGEQERLQFGAYLPGISSLDKNPSTFDIGIDHKISETAAFEDHDTDLILFTLPQEKLPADLYHLFYGLARRALMQRGFYCVHAACVGEGDDYKLIVGHSGAGKTSLTQKLIEKHGLKLFSGNKTVVEFAEDGSIHAVAGTKSMTALDRALDRYAYEMTDEQYAQKQRVIIKSIDIVRLNDGVEEEQRLSPSSALHTLYPYFMDAVNADVIVNGIHMFDGTPNTASKEYLAKKLYTATTQIPVHKYSGSMNFLQKRVLQL